MTDRSSRPDNSAHDYTIKGLHAFFTLWIAKIEERFNDLFLERHRYYEERFKAQDEKTTLALANAEKAISKAEMATEKRFDAVNEFRGTLSDQAATLLPRAEATTKFSSYDEKLEDLKKEVQSLRESRSESTGSKTQARDDRAVAIAIAGMIGGVIGVVIDFVVRVPK